MHPLHPKDFIAELEKISFEVMKILEDCQADADAHEAKHKELEVQTDPVAPGSSEPHLSAREKQKTSAAKEVDVNKRCTSMFPGDFSFKPQPVRDFLLTVVFAFRFCTCQARSIFMISVREW